MKLKEIEDTYKDLSVDKHALDEELVAMPQLVMLYNEWVAEAYEQRDHLKNLLDLERAKLDAAVRSNPTGYGIKEKVTESAISSVIIQSEKIVDLQNQIIQSQKELNVLSGARDAVRNKGIVLENLVKLRLAEYYTDSGSKPLLPTRRAEKKIRGPHSESVGETLRKRKLSRD